MSHTRAWGRSAVVGGGSTREVICEDCIQSTVKCADCFIDDHIHMPFHWARRWDILRQFFVRTDISVVRGDQRPYAVPLGHNGNVCPHYTPNELLEHARELPEGVILTVVDVNGIHGTRFMFCSCSNAPPRHVQLIRAKLLPGTTRFPLTVVTFTALRMYRSNDLVSKGNAQDYLRSLQRATEETRYWDIPVRMTYLYSGSPLITL